MPTVDEQVNFLQNNIQNAYNKYIMVKTTTVSGEVNPWFSIEFKILINDRNEAYKLWKRYRIPELGNIFRNCRRRIKYEKKAAKCKFYEDKFSTGLSSQGKLRIRIFGQE